MAESEVMRLMEELELRCQAACLGLHGYAKVAKHEIIANRFEAIGRCQDELEKLIGPEEANKTVALTYIRVMDGEAAAISKDRTKNTETDEIGSVSGHMVQCEKEC
ncbi:MAG TPA: hypothetical protein VN207_05205 [Ktedonobacteraceae bacterium]|nr:hypothetical protein [Ktedonobacteraceae bacterium]